MYLRVMLSGQKAHGPCSFLSVFLLLKPVTASVPWPGVSCSVLSKPDCVTHHCPLYLLMQAVCLNLHNYALFYWSKQQAITGVACRCRPFCSIITSSTSEPINNALVQAETWACPCMSHSDCSHSHKPSDRCKEPSDHMERSPVLCAVIVTHAVTLTGAA